MSRQNSSSGGDMLGLIGIIVVGVGIFLWYVHRVVAWMVLFLTRDVVVYLGGAFFGDYAARAAIVVWRVIVPVTAACIGFGVTYGQLAQPNRYVPWVLNLPLSLTVAGLFLYHYYDLYRQTLPHHHSWSRFTAADALVQTSLKLAWIEETFRWRL